MTKPINNGIDEQEQNGVITPNSDAKRNYHTDQEQQDQNFDTVVEKEIDSASEMCFGAHPEYAVDEPVGKSLNHRFNRNKLLHNKCPRL